MSRFRSTPSRLYLLPTALAIALGVLTFLSHLRQPDFPALPGRGCLVTKFPSPDTLYLPTPYLELNACLHISETVLELHYYDESSDRSASLFEASVEDDPRLWSRAVRIQWIGTDTIQVSYRADVRFASQDTAFWAGHVIYRPLP